jgi:hypothetical protein
MPCPFFFFGSSDFSVDTPIALFGKISADADFKKYCQAYALKELLIAFQYKIRKYDPVRYNCRKYQK